MNESIRLDLPASRQYAGALAACIGAVLERIEGLTETAASNIQQTVREAFLHLVGEAAGEDESRVEVVLSLTSPPPPSHR